jgi:hypothetical protein
MLSLFGFRLSRNGTHRDPEEQFKEISKLGDETRKSPEAKIAIRFCKDCILEYQEWVEFNDKRWSLWQRVIIIGGTVATLAGAATLPPNWWPELHYFGWLRGVPQPATSL